MNEQNQTSFGKFRKISTLIFRISWVFLIIFMAIFYIFTSIRIIDLGINDPWTAFFDILLGVSLIAIFILLYLISNTRVGALTTFLGLVVWAFIPTGSFIFDEWDRIGYYFSTTYHLSMGITYYFLGVFLLGVLNFIGQTIHVIKNKRSGFWGPWFANYKEANFKRMAPDKKRRIAKGLVISAILVGITIPGILPQFDVYRIPIEIRPQDYQVKFNFWASSSLSSYSTEVRETLNNHSANLDLTFNQVTYSVANTLELFESAMENITYRVTLAPPELALLPNYVQDATNILMEYEANNSLDQWLGFAFNIETDAFKPTSSNLTFDEGLDVWNDVFDWVENKSLQRGKTIEMECISYVEMATDVAFDGDFDQHLQYGYPSFIPERFTLYAPMLYRCQFEGEPPYGENNDPLDPWWTSYRIYNPLLTLQAGVPEKKMGLYLGITNLTCYSTDLPQNEEHTWPEGETSGFMNLARDVLIGKHFGIKEITFFLQSTSYPGDWIMGGAFDAYGNDFLDKMNETVNTNPPESFTILYSHKASIRSSEKLRFDWFFDTNRISGLLEILAIGISAVLFTFFFDMVKSQSRNKKIIESR
ncbi:MAG: hypothetical protein ACFFCS_20145 [Candidatus Hodarchaeota archaeon]